MSAGWIESPLENSWGTDSGKFFLLSRLCVCEMEIKQQLRREMGTVTEWCKMSCMQSYAVSRCGSLSVSLCKANPSSGWAECWRLTLGWGGYSIHISTRKRHPPPTVCLESPEIIAVWTAAWGEPQLDSCEQASRLPQLEQATRMHRQLQLLPMRWSR